MRKTLIYVVVLVGLCGIIYYIFNRNNDNPYGLNEAGFSVKDTASIGRIFIADYEGATILVERTDSGWMLNKRYKALPSMLRMTLNTIYQLQALYPVTQNAIQSAIKNLSTLSTKVEVYDKKGKVLTKFYVGSVAPNNSGTIMMMEGAQKPYVVHIQNFVGVLSNRFSGNDKDWRDRNIFDLPQEEVKRVAISYNDKPQNSFEITHDNTKITVTGTDKNAPKEKPEDLNMHNANLYMSYFANINCEGYLNGSDGMDSIIRNSHKHSVIDVEGVHGQHKHVEVYWIAINKRSKNLVSADPNVPDDYDADRLYAIINNNKDTVMIQNYVFKNIFRKYSDFYQKVIPPPAN